MTEREVIQALGYGPPRNVQATPIHPPIQTSTPEPRTGPGVGTNEPSGGTVDRDTD